MLSSVLSSKMAIRANIAIMRAFVRIRELSSQNREIIRKLDQLERRVGHHDADIGALIDAIREDATPAEEPCKRIGFDP